MIGRQAADTLIPAADRATYRLDLAQRIAGDGIVRRRRPA